jgi:hypothetical protein
VKPQERHNKEGKEAIDSKAQCVANLMTKKLQIKVFGLYEKRELFL